MSKLRTGDILIFNTLSGGTIQTVNGEPEMTGGFESAVYITLFGGNGNDLWMNEYLTEEEKIKSEFIGFIESAPLTLFNIKRAEQLAQTDLKWFIDSGIADIIEIEIEATGNKRIDLTVDIQKDKETLFKNIYQINWGFQESSPSSGRIL